MADLVERLTVQADVGLFGMPDYLEIVSYKECLAVSETQEKLK